MYIVLFYFLHKDLGNIWYLFLFFVSLKNGCHALSSRCDPPGVRDVVCADSGTQSSAGTVWGSSTSLGRATEGNEVFFKLILMLNSLYMDFHLPENTRNEFIGSSSCGTAQRYKNHRTRFKLEINVLRDAQTFWYILDLVPLFVGMWERSKTLSWLHTNVQTTFLHKNMYVPQQQGYLPRFV